MPNYQETNAQATAWRRCNRILVENPSGQQPRIKLFEEDIVNINGKIISKDCGVLDEAFSPSSVVMLRDYPSGELTGAYVTQEYVFQVLYSFYMQCAEQRDNPTTPGILIGQS